MFKWTNAIRNSLRRYMESIAEENNKQYGNKRLDCCDLKKK